MRQLPQGLVQPGDTSLLLAAILGWKTSAGGRFTALVLGQLFLDRSQFGFELSVLVRQATKGGGSIPHRSMASNVTPCGKSMDERMEN